jgi:hypothetical protein
MKKNTSMKNWIIILLCLILGFAIYILVGKYNSFIIGPKHFKYQDCDMKYKQEYVNWTQSSLFYPNNSWLEDSARTVFIKCLCDRYIASQDSFIKGYIESAYDELRWYQINYIRDVKGLDTNILMRFKEKIFKNDPRGINAINKYCNDTLILRDILVLRFHENNSIRQEYYDVIHSLPAEKVNIDTLIKYKDIIFTIPPHYGDA